MPHGHLLGPAAYRWLGSIGKCLSFSSAGGNRKNLREKKKGKKHSTEQGLDTAICNSRKVCSELHTRSPAGRSLISPEPRQRDRSVHILLLDRGSWLGDGELNGQRTRPRMPHGNPVAMHAESHEADCCLRAAGRLAGRAHPRNGNREKVLFYSTNSPKLENEQQPGAGAEPMDRG